VCLPFVSGSASCTGSSILKNTLRRLSWRGWTRWSTCSRDASRARSSSSCAHRPSSILCRTVQRLPLGFAGNFLQPRVDEGAGSAEEQGGDDDVNVCYRQ
jgi:hypothetical protein